MTYDQSRVRATTRARWGLKSVKQRFQEKVTVDLDSYCWLWTAALNGHGYGQMNIDGKPVKAHRISWMLYRGDLDEVPTLDHLCRVKTCVNPDHLEPVTLAENTRRKHAAIGHHNANKTECANGHPYSAENTRFASRGTQRVCRVCRAESSRQYRARKKVS